MTFRLVNISTLTVVLKGDRLCGGYVVHTVQVGIIMDCPVQTFDPSFGSNPQISYAILGLHATKCTEDGLTINPCNYLVCPLHRLHSRKYAKYGLKKIHMHNSVGRYCFFDTQYILRQNILIQLNITIFEEFMSAQQLQCIT